MAKKKSKLPAVDRRLDRQADQLATENGEEVPVAVRAVEQLVSSAGCWYLLNRNREAYDCEQAALVRSCLGTGIPLSRELKSFLGGFTDEAGQLQKVVVHHRANTKLDFTKVNALLGGSADFHRLELPDAQRGGDSGYGLINPFTMEIASREGDPHLQVFDEGVFQRDELPNTIMTNSGDRTWSIEFESNDLLEIISKRLLLRGDVVAERRHLHRPKIGILTGNSPESGALLWDVLLKSVRESRKELEAESFRDRNPDSMRQVCLELSGDVYMPEVHIRSVPAMGMTMELHLRRRQIWEEIGPQIDALCSQLAAEKEEAGNILCIACNTTQHFAAEIREIAAKYNVRYLSMSEAVERFLVEQGITDIALLGIGYIHHLEFSGYAELLRSASPVNVHKLAPATLKKIEDLAFAVKETKRPDHNPKKSSGQRKTEQEVHLEFVNYIRSQFREILNRKDVLQENVVIALTELSLVVEWAGMDLLGERTETKHGFERQVFDSIQIYAAMLSDMFLGIRDLSGDKIEVASSATA